MAKDIRNIYYLSGQHLECTQNQKKLKQRTSKRANDVSGGNVKSTYDVVIHQCRHLKNVAIAKCISYTIKKLTICI